MFTKFNNDVALQKFNNDVRQKLVDKGLDLKKNVAVQSVKNNLVIKKEKSPTDEEKIEDFI